MQTDSLISDIAKGVAILVPSWDGYQDVWPAFFHCLFKYWPDCPFDIFLGTTSRQFQDHRVVSLPIGIDVDYSSNLRLMLQNIDHDWVLIWVDDFLLCDVVDTPRVCRLIGKAQEKGATSLLLHRTKSLNSIKGSDQAIEQIPVSTPYRVSLSPAVWRKRDLINLLREGENPWQFEREGTRRAIESDYHFYGVTPAGGGPPLTTVNSIIKGRVTSETIQFLASEGFEHHLSKRQKLSFASQQYIRLRRFAPQFLVGWWHKFQSSNSRTRTL